MVFELLAGVNGLDFAGERFTNGAHDFVEAVLHVFVKLCYALVEPVDALLEAIFNVLDLKFYSTDVAL
jgi:hypothetical protein